MAFQLRAHARRRTEESLPLVTRPPAANAGLGGSLSTLGGVIPDKHHDLVPQKHAPSMEAAGLAFGSSEQVLVIEYTRIDPALLLSLHHLPQLAEVTGFLVVGAKYLKGKVGALRK